MDKVTHWNYRVIKGPEYPTVLSIYEIFYIDGTPTYFGEQKHILKGDSDNLEKAISLYRAAFKAPILDIGLLKPIKPRRQNAHTNRNHRNRA